MKTKKHNHTLTNILKVLVFSLMILMPFIIFIPNAFYYGFNETAVAQEKTEQVPVYYESNDVNTFDDLIAGNVYHIELNNFDSSHFIINLEQYFTYGGNYNGIDGNVSKYNNTIVPYLRNTNAPNRYNNYYLVYQIGQTSDEGYQFINQFHCDFVFGNNNQAIYVNPVLQYITKCNNQYIKEYQPLVTDMSITDSMSYAWKSTWENELFSWTNKTAIYSGINATTSGIGISENSYIANYLTYIFLLTIIYVIIDIILGVFTMLTHIFNKEPK